MLWFARHRVLTKLLSLNNESSIVGILDAVPKAMFLLTFNAKATVTFVLSSACEGSVPIRAPACRVKCWCYARWAISNAPIWSISQSSQVGSEGC